MLIENLSTDLLVKTSLASLRNEKGSRTVPYNLFKWWGRRFSVLSRVLLASLVVDSEKLVEETIYGVIPEEILSKSRNKVIYDPFVGGGTIVYEASKLGFNALGIDINPIAIAINKATLTALNKNVCYKVAKCLLKSLNITYSSTKSLWEFEGKLIVHVFASKCPPCEAPIWISSKRGSSGIKKYLIINRETGEIIEIQREKLKYNVTPRTPTIDLNPKKNTLPKIAPKTVAYAVELYDPSTNKRSIYTLLSNNKLSKKLKNFLEESGKKARDQYYKIVKHYDLRIPSLRETKRLLKNGMKYVGELFTWRQLVTLAEFLRNCSKECIREAALIAGNTARTASLLAIYYQPYSKVNPGLVIKSYWLPQNPVELNPIAFRHKGDTVESIGRGTLATYISRYFKTCMQNTIEFHGKVKFRVGDSTAIKPPLNTYAIVTDPPYPGHYTYSDMSLLYRYFLEKTCRIDYSKAITNELTPHDSEKYVLKFNKFIGKISSLKKNRYVIIMLGVPKKEYVNTLRQITLSFIKHGFGLRKVYWVLGESPGIIGRSRTRGIYVFVFKKKAKNRRDAIEPLFYISKIIEEINSEENSIVNVDYELNIHNSIINVLAKILTQSENS